MIEVLQKYFLEESKRSWVFSYLPDRDQVLISHTDGHRTTTTLHFSLDEWTAFLPKVIDFDQDIDTEHPNKRL